MNPYVTGGYGAAAGIIGAYALYVRRRVRSLVKSAPPEHPAVVAEADPQATESS